MSQLLIKLIEHTQTKQYFIFRSLATIGSKTVNTTQANTHNNEDNKASPDQLAQVEKCMLIYLPKFFSTPHNYDIYSKDVLLIDNIRGVRAQGLGPYATQVNLIKLYHIVKYSHAQLELLNLVKVPEESCLRIRWRVVGKPGFARLLLFFWKFASEVEWKDGISTMHVNNTGLIDRHVCDNIDIQTEDLDSKKKSIKNPLINRGLNV